MLQRKVCLLGAYAVGKTSLVSRYVHSIFSEKYHTTVGVKIDKKRVTVGAQQLTLILWDLHGEDRFQQVRTAYLRGMAGYLLVLDGTRRETLASGLQLRQRVAAAVGEVPCVVAVNKADLRAEWELTPAALDPLTERGAQLFETSAKSGAGVETAFAALAARLTG